MSKQQTIQIKTESRLAVEALFRGQSISVGYTLAEISAKTGMDCKRAVHNMRQSGWLDAHSVPGKPHKRLFRAYISKAEREAGLTTPIKSTDTCLTASRAIVSGVERTSMSDRPVYDGAELKPYTGRPGANDHMQWGSVVNGKRVPYVRPVLM